MLINYGSFMYCAYILLVLAVCMLLYRILKNRSTTVKQNIVFLIALLNFLQHIFKLKLYPQYAGSSSIYLTTAYNICAFLIILSPFILLWGNVLLKNFITYVGTFAGMAAMLVPYWFIGKSAFTWEVYRFYICHGLLFISSILSAILGLYKLERKHCWKVGLLFLLSLAIILLNDAVLVVTDNYYTPYPDNLFESLKYINPGWSMRPSPDMPWVEEIVALFTPSFLLGENPWGVHIPILWYAIPLYLGITFLTYLVYGIIYLVFKRKRK